MEMVKCIQGGWGFVTGEIYPIAGREKGIQIARPDNKTVITFQQYGHPEGYEITCALLNSPIFGEIFENDPVNPAHYSREGAMETIDEMILIFGKEEVKSFCKLNAWKYRARALSKNGEEDMQKSDWYPQKFKELNETPARDFRIKE